jgi:hypothetical protein
MNTELPEIIVTRGEKLLASTLAVFLLVGGLWAYFEPLDRDSGYVEPERVRETPAQQRALDASRDARREQREARSVQRTRLRAYELAREAYRTDLEAAAPTAGSQRAFERAEQQLDAARARVRGAAAEVRRTTPAARDARRQVAAAERRAFAAAEREDRERGRETVFLRLGWCLAWIAAAFALLTWLRRRRSRYFVAGAAAVAAATAQAVVMAGDYLSDDVDLGHDGPLVLSIAGVSASILALVGLERYLARRAPRRRVRRGDCPYCAYPVRGNTRCEGCGRELFAPCSTCASERRVGTPHCGACGAA